MSKPWGYLISNGDYDDTDLQTAIITTTHDKAQLKLAVDAFCRRTGCDPQEVVINPILPTISLCDAVRMEAESAPLARWEKSSILRDFHVWSGGFFPWECDRSEQDAYCTGEPERVCEFIRNVREQDLPTIQ